MIIKDLGVLPSKVSLMDWVEKGGTNFDNTRVRNGVITEIEDINIDEAFKKWAIDNGWIRKESVVDKMENLYGGTRDFPNTTEENEESVLEIWNTAIKKCVEIAEAIKEAL